MNFWKTTAIYGIGFMCLRAISFLLLPLYTNLLSQSDVGWIFIIYTVLAFLNVLYTHGMNAALFKFFHSSDRKEIITTSVLYSVVYGIVLSGLLLIVYALYAALTSHQPEYLLVILILLVAVLDMVSSRNNVVLRLLERPYYYLSVCFVNVLLSIILNVYFIQFCGLGLWGAVVALFCVSLIQFLLLSPIIIMYCRLVLFNKNLLKQMLRFSFAFFPAAVFFVLIEMSDRWILGYLQGVNEVGLYGAGYKIGSIILLLVNSFNLNWQPYYLKTGLKNGVSVFQNIGEHFILILLFSSTMLSILWPIIFKYIIGDAFWEGGNIVPIVCSSYVFYGIFILQMPSIYLAKKQTWAPLFWGSGFIVNLLMNFILIPRFGIYGAAYATLLAYFTMSIMLIYKNQTWLPIQYKIRKLGFFFLFSGASYYLSKLIYQFNNLQCIYLVVFVYAVLGVYYIYYTSSRLIPTLD